MSTIVVEGEPAVRPLFLLPSLADLADDVVEPLDRVAGADPPPPWQGWIDVVTVDLLLAELTPLLRALLLAGYEVPFVEFAVDAAGPWVQTWQLTGEVAQSATRTTASAWPAGARLVVSLLVNPLGSAAADRLAMTTGLPLPTTWSPDAPQHELSLSSTTVAATTGELLRAVADASVVGTPGGLSLAAFVDGLVAGLADRWRRGAVVPYSFGEPPGLLWLFDPENWGAPPPTWTSPGAALVTQIAAQVLTVADGDADSFVRGQVVAHQTHADAEAASLGGLLEQAYGKRGEARSSRRGWFREMEALFLATVDVGQPDPGTPSFRNLCGPRILGYRSDLRWLEVILAIAAGRLLPFPSLLHPELPYAYESEEPLEVTLTSDEKGVELRVLGAQEPVTVRRDYDLGVEPERCFSWEYMGPDAAGVPTLVVVAAPGVSVSGREHVPSTVRLLVLRLQDHALIPRWGEHIVLDSLLGARDLDPLLWKDDWLLEDGASPPEDPEAPPPTGAAALAFRIDRMPLGIRITYPAVAADEAEFLVDIEVEEGAALQRYSYDVSAITDDPSGFDPDGRIPYALVVQVTDGVKVHVRHYSGSENSIREIYQLAVPAADDPPHQALANIYPPGEPLTIDVMEMTRLGLVALPAGALFTRELWEGEKLLLQMIAELTIGFSPIGDAVDIAELGASLVTGNDKWGNPVTAGEQLVMFGGAALPFVSSGAIRGVIGAAP